jgi:hypothetical protein
MPEVVHRSLPNLMQSPAWQQCGPAVNASLIFDKIDDSPVLVDLIHALAPLASKEVSLTIDMPEGWLSASEV